MEWPLFNVVTFVGIHSVSRRSGMWPRGVLIESKAWLTECQLVSTPLLATLPTMDGSDNPTEVIIVQAHTASFTDVYLTTS